MNLGHVERGMKLTIYEELQGRAVSDEFEAVFRYQESAKTFVVQSAGLYETYEKLAPGASLNIRFLIEPNSYMFKGRPMEKQRASGMVMIEQVTDIETVPLRKFDRDELRLSVNIFGLPEYNLPDHYHAEPERQPDMADITYDLSAGGICVISSTLLTSIHDPYYLIAFSVTDRDRFILPAKLVRRSNHPKTQIGRYDYGFQFDFDNMPEEKVRLTRAILNRKLSHY